MTTLLQDTGKGQEEADLATVERMFVAERQLVGSFHTIASGWSKNDRQRLAALLLAREIVGATDLNGHFINLVAAAAVPLTTRWLDQALKLNK